MPDADAAGSALSWVGDERVAISGVPSAGQVAQLAEQGALIHCSAGKRRSVMLTYAVLRLRGHVRDRAAALVLSYRAGAQLVPASVHSVERWLEQETY